MLPVKAHRDPAPSRIKYRLERLWLRPAIRYAVRVGLPLVAVGWVAITTALDPGVQAWTKTQAQALRDRVAAHPGLMISDLRLEGMSAEMTEAVATELALELPVSSMDIDLDTLQQRVAALPAIAAAEVQLAGGGVLRVRVRERVPALLWRGPDGLQLLDPTGVAIGPAASRAAFSALPVVAGDGADQAAAEALDLLALAEPMGAKVRGLNRVADRRWTLVLANGIEVQLPEVGAAAALSRVMALHQAEDILNRDLVAVDMRDGRRPILRLTPEALLTLRRAQGLIGEDDA